MNRPPPESTLDPLATEPRSAELDAAIAELASGWAEGANPRAEAFAGRVAAEGPDALVELAYLEFCLAEAASIAPDPEAYLARFPNIRSSLSRLFRLHGAVGDSVLQAWSETRTIALPDAGDEVGPYRLLRELGRGGLARVFLAEQADLDDRLVVLKVATRSSPEAILQARARHPHIVEILRQAQTGDGSLHLIAMPFLGGATLAAVLARESAGSRGLLAALDQVSAPEFLVAETNRSASRDLLAASSRAQAAAWIVARLADALDHASRLGVTHGDLKPANILIAADARPMLFDFNLAAAWKTPVEALDAPTGGTLAYMAPERLQAMADPKSALPPRAADHHRADLYSLGLVLREVLTGRPPIVPAGAISSPREAAAAMAEARGRADASLWLANRGIPASLRPILARCLAANPADRYARMSQLAEDLDRWREGRPLLHASESNGPGARVARWVGRHRAGVAVAAVVVLVAAIAVVASWSIMSARMRQQAEAKLAALWDSGEPGVFRARKFGAWRNDDQATSEWARRNLDRYNLLGSKDWRDRDDVRALNQADRDDLEAWLLEQAWRLASTWSRRTDSPDDWRSALALLERSPEWAALGPFFELRVTLRQRLGAEPPAPSRLRPPSWLESYAAGLALEVTDPREAASAYAAVLAERPQALWPRHRAAAVASRQGDHAGAAEHLARCLARRPASPTLLIQMANCLLLAGKYMAALEACDRAVSRDPDHREAYFTRGLIRVKLGQAAAAQADVDRYVALSRGRPVDAWQGRQALANASPGGPRPAGSLPEAAEVQGYVGALLERKGRSADAILAYEKAIEYDPEDLQSRARRAALLWQDRRNEGINEMADVIASPGFEELVRRDEYTLRLCHFVVEHRLMNGDAKEAIAIAERALAISESHRPAGAAESPLVAESRYALARALVPGAVTDPAYASRAADLLRRAGQTDPQFIDVKFPRDPFFDAARKQITSSLR